MVAHSQQHAHTHVAPQANIPLLPADMHRYHIRPWDAVLVLASTGALYSGVARPVHTPAQADPVDPPRPSIVCLSSCTPSPSWKAQVLPIPHSMTEHKCQSIEVELIPQVGCPNSPYPPTLEELQQIARLLRGLFICEGATIGSEWFSSLPHSMRAIFPADLDAVRVVSISTIHEKGAGSASASKSAKKKKKKKKEATVREAPDNGTIEEACTEVLSSPQGGGGGGDGEMAASAVLTPETVLTDMLLGKVYGVCDAHTRISSAMWTTHDDFTPMPPVSNEDVMSSSPLHTLVGVDTVVDSLEQMICLQGVDHLSLVPGALQLPQGALVHGPAGVGKRTAIRKVASRHGCPVVVIQPSDVYTTDLGQAEHVLRQKFAQARVLATEHQRPCILILESIDLMCPPRDQGSNQSLRVVAQLLTLLDGVQARGNVLVIGVTNEPDGVDLALRRAGRLELELPVRPQTVSERLTLLENLSSKMGITVQVALDLDTIARETVGYTASDIVALWDHSCLRALQQHVQTDAPVVLQGYHIMEGMAAVPGSLSRRTIRRSEHSSLSWDHIGGLGDVKTRLLEAVQLPLQSPDALIRLGIAPIKGVLLYGPPGCSKTTLVRTVVSHCRMSLFSLSGASVYSSYLGEAERAVRDVFTDARLAAPSVVFLDEIDGLVGARHALDAGGVQARVLSTLLNEMDGVASSQGVIVIAASNRPDLIDSALLRPGRIDSLLYVGLPETSDRQQVRQNSPSIPYPPPSLSRTLPLTQLL
eukprot:TRINITY_DN674_c0_g1_i1.p1 TRINITY_DN674_c0_g1~~TRINITY_DN674_c0_g1_i1.p1  ORF type:complete len:759 (+),score=62.89 TRINITY_DN674_c0_g1_i1:416-2692(+)